MTRPAPGSPTAVVSIATLHSDVPDDMTLAEYRRSLSSRADRRRLRRPWRRTR